MRIWAKLISDHKIRSDVVQEFALARPSDLLGWTPIIGELCRLLDVERPVILNKHIHELGTFHRTVFRASDFMDAVSFDRLELEIFPEKKTHDSFSSGVY